MYKILSKQQLSAQVFRLTIEAPEIAAKHQAGQFIILRISASGERIPLTIANSDAKQGTIELIVQAVGKTTTELLQLPVGGTILDLAGPLGVPTHIEKVGTIIMVGGGVGTAPLYPIAKAFKHAGNKIITILGARNKELILLEKEFREFSDELIVITDDGSSGKKGLVTNAIQELIDAGLKIDKVVTIGPLVMMKFVTMLTKKYSLPTIVSLNSMMIDGTGMCGGCRVRIGNEIKFTCVHGPEFDGHLVDFDTLLKRSAFYKHEEQCQLDAYLKGQPNG